MRLLFTRRLPGGKGFTLVEALLVLTILGIVLAAIAPLMRATYIAWNTADRNLEIMQNGRAALELMVRFIRQAHIITVIPASGSGSYITFRNTFDTQGIIFFHNVAGSPYYPASTANGRIKDNDLVMRTIDNNGAATDSLLAKSLSAFRMDFKNNSGAAATRPSDVYSVDISMGLYDPEGIVQGIMNLFSTVSIRSELRIESPAIDISVSP